MAALVDRLYLQHPQAGVIERVRSRRKVGVPLERGLRLSKIVERCEGGVAPRGWNRGVDDGRHDDQYMQQLRMVAMQAPHQPLQPSPAVP